MEVRRIVCGMVWFKTASSKRCRTLLERLVRISAGVKRDEVGILAAMRARMETVSFAPSATPDEIKSLLESANNMLYCFICCIYCRGCWSGLGK